ncbi:nitroreductase family protein [Williamsia sterculiae]|uniref:Nitroreductase n=1 Tax=Williamsia sterculiae TaxID=1344003 RepID=A0A1N7DGT9_9NOCA|nr:nitroreductase family protein [Williamsia sterculiae]SIR75073.1 Nitroreductase [Williamsia sterculiae]
MTELLPLNPDELLSTTRAVRKRLDLERPVDLSVVREALDIAMQAPTGSNSQGWHWIVLTDPDKRRAVAELYKKSFDTYAAARPETSDETMIRVSASSRHLADHMAEVPVLVLGAIHAGKSLPEGNQAPLWGSLLPAAWSLQLALRARGLGSTWTTLHLTYEQETADLLGIPSNVRQGVLLPVAYTKGTDFQPGPRRDNDATIHINGW